MYLSPRSRSTTHALTVGILAAANLVATASAAAPSPGTVDKEGAISHPVNSSATDGPVSTVTLSGEALQVGPITLAVTRGAPTSIVLLDQDSADSATPVGYALNEVMVQLGGHRISTIDLSDLWRPLRPLATFMANDARTEAINRFKADYKRAGQPLPDDFESQKALLVVDWEGTWRATLAPGCARGHAVAFVDENSALSGVLCEPTADAAADRWRALLSEWRTAP